jgi:hypothetical protein
MKQISEIIYSYARIQEKVPELYFKCAPIIKEKYKELNSIEIFNIYWGFASSRIYLKEFYAFMEDIIIKQHLNKNMSMESLI